MAFCREFDAKNAPQLQHAPTETWWLDASEAENVSPASVFSPGHGALRNLVSRGGDMLY